MMMRLGARLAALALMTVVTACSQGASTYDVTSETATGNAQIETQDIRYICSHVGLFGTDLVRWSCQYAKNVSESGKSVRFNTMTEAEAKQLSLRPAFDWWERFGRFVLLLVVFVAGVVQAGIDAWRRRQQPALPDAAAH